MTIEPTEQMLDTGEVAKRLGRSRRQVQTLIQREELPAVRIGRDWFVKASVLADFKLKPKTGRPPKSEASGSDKYEPDAYELTASTKSDRERSESPRTGKKRKSRKK